MIMGAGLGDPWAPGVVPFPVGASPAAQAAAATAAAQAAAATTKAVKAVKKAAASKPAAASSSTSGIVATVAALPWLKIGLVAAGVVGAYVLLKGSKEEARENPEDEELDENPREAFDFYRDFHWGREPKRVRHVPISPTPKELVKLGVLEAVTYSAKKGAGKLADYIHHFGEEGGKKPVLAADPRTKRLHVLGGDYDIESAGIID